MNNASAINQYPMGISDMSKNEDFNSIVMNEVGLEVDPYGNIVDQDTRSILAMNGKYLTANGNKDKSKIPFNPQYNFKLMQFIFGYYCKKLEQENGTHVNVVYTAQDDKEKKLASLGIRVNDNEEIESRCYHNESLRVMDLICRLNGSTNPDLTKYDFSDFPNT